MPMVIRIPFGGGIGAVEHHAESPESFFCHIAGLRVVACANAQDAYDMIRAAIACDDPVVFLEPKRRYWEKSDLDTDSRRGDQGRPPRCFSSIVRRPGTDVTVVSYGPSMPVLAKAADAAAAEGRITGGHRSAHAVAARPRTRCSSRCARRAGWWWSREAPLEASITSEIAARVTEEAFYSLAAPVLRVGGFDTPYPPSRIEENYLPDLDKVLDAVDRALAY